MTNSSGLALYGGYAVADANAYGIPPALFLNQINQESGFNTTNSSGGILTSSAGALGIAQILPSTAASPGYGVSPVDPTDPYSSIDFMAQYDAAMYARTGSWPASLAAYNAGLGNIPGGSPYAAAIENGPFNSSTVAQVATNTGAGGVSTPTSNQPSWMPDWLWNAIGGASAVTAAVTGQTTNGVTPQAAQQATGIASVTNALNTFNTTLSSALSGATWERIALAVLGIVVILGALVWLAQSGEQGRAIPVPA